MVSATPRKLASTMVVSPRTTPPRALVLKRPPRDMPFPATGAKFSATCTELPTNGKLQVSYAPGKGKHYNMECVHCGHAGFRVFVPKHHDIVAEIQFASSAGKKHDAITYHQNEDGTKVKLKLKDTYEIRKYT
ncbi:MAG: hypothetical protein SGARI_004193, partial [Bacillariaceae sp.]